MSTVPTYEAMTADTIGFLDKVVGGPADLVGWSDGGVVALLVALDRPDLVRKLVMIGVNYHVDGLFPGFLQTMDSMTADGEEMAVFRDPYTAASPDGPDHWPVMFGKVLELLASPANDRHGTSGFGRRAHARHGRRRRLHRLRAHRLALRGHPRFAARRRPRRGRTSSRSRSPAC